MVKERLPLPPGGIAPNDVWWTEPEAGIQLRAALWQAQNPIGHVVFLTGRTEFLEKVAVPAAAFVQRGFSVLSWDWRGQGLSSRQASPALKGHVEDFAEFQTDLDAILATEPARRLTGKRLIVAHSMGGCIAAQALARPKVVSTIDAAILCAPMLGIAMHPVMRAAAAVAVRVGLLLGKGDSWPPFGDVKTPYVLTDPEDNVLTSDTSIMAWMAQVARDHPESALAMPTLQWFKAANDAMRAVKLHPAPSVPTLCLLGERERVVDYEAVEAGARRMQARLEHLKYAQHELFIETEAIRTEVWRKIDAFLETHAFPIRN